MYRTTMVLNVSVETTIVEGWSGNRTLHQILSTSLCIFGSLLNLMCISVLIKGGLFRQPAFTFVLNLFVGNFCASAVCLPIFASFAFSSDVENQRSTTCPFLGYLICCIAGTSALNTSLVSVNQYVHIVRFTSYERIYSSRNTGIILAITWLSLPVLYLFPLTNVWGNFEYDKLRFFCNPLITDSGFRNLTLVIFATLTTPPISFCYFQILRKLKSSGRNVVNAMQSVHGQRKRNERRLLRTIIVLISVFVGMVLPFIVLTITDPHMNHLDIRLHTLAFYIGLSSYTANTLLFLLFNQQIKSAFIEIVKRMFKKKDATQDLGIGNTECGASSNL